MHNNEWNAEEIRKRIHESADYLAAAGVYSPEIGVILGSGQNDYADNLSDAVVIPYSDIPNFRTGNVDGHRGQLIYGKHMGRRVILMAGRFHFYECGDMQMTVFPTRVLIELGIKRLIITNAAGCVNRNWKVGQMMMISDHINLSGGNPLIGPNLDEYGPRFPDMSYTYNKELRDKLRQRASECGIDLTEGVYAMMSGPSFETPAEIHFLDVIGADAVGMSSVPEAIIANHAGLEVIGISLLANMAAGVLDKALSGSEVTEESSKVKDTSAKVIDLAISI